MSTWEERQGARARARRLTSERIEQQTLEAEIRKRDETWIGELVSEMTLEDAEARLLPNDIACACTGGKYCCVLRFKAAERVVAAHNSKMGTSNE